MSERRQLNFALDSPRGEIILAQRISYSSKIAGWQRIPVDLTRIENGRKRRNKLFGWFIAAEEARRLRRVVQWRKVECSLRFNARLFQG